MAFLLMLTWMLMLVLLNGGLAEEKRVGNCDGIDDGFGSKIIIVCFLLSLLKM